MYDNSKFIVSVICTVTAFLFRPLGQRFEIVDSFMFVLYLFAFYGRTELAIRFLHRWLNTLCFTVELSNTIGVSDSFILRLRAKWLALYLEGALAERLVRLARFPSAMISLDLLLVRIGVSEWGLAICREILSAYVTSASFIQLLLDHGMSFDERLGLQRSWLLLFLFKFCAVFRIVVVIIIIFTLQIFF